MPMSCSVKGCKSRYKAGSFIRFFGFPFKDSHRLECWTKTVGRENWKATRASKICSLHFLSTDFLTELGYHNTQLRSNAVPMLLLNNSHNMENMQRLNVMSTQDRTEENRTGDIQLIGSSNKQAFAEKSSNTSVIAAEKCLPENGTSVNMSLASSSTKSVELKQQCESPPVNQTTSTKRARDEEEADASGVHKKEKVMFPGRTCVMMSLQSSSSETSSEENTAAETKIKQLTERNKKLARKVKSLKQVVRRRDWKIKNMTELLETLKRKNLIDDDLLIILNNSGLCQLHGDLKDNILYYICGYTLKQLLLRIECESCISHLILKRTDHDYTHRFTFSKFVDQCNNGELISPSPSAFKIVGKAEKLLQLETNGFRNLKIHNLDVKIILLVKKRFALDKSIFPDLECENVDPLEMPHKIKLIVAIVRKFLQVRLYSYGKFYVQEILTPIRKRHHLTKKILFANE